VYDAEIRVPLWFLSIAGGLSDQETRALNALRTERLLMLDMLPTLLDLAGVWRRSEWEHELRNMPGESLLRGGSPRERPEVLTNCTGIWGCSYPNWGVIAGHRKLIAHKYSPGWQCFDLASDPEEQEPKAPEDGCADLVPIAERQGRPFVH
jgi:arylsulfatase A-like enzyme